MALAVSRRWALSPRRNVAKSMSCNGRGVVVSVGQGVVSGRGVMGSRSYRDDESLCLHSGNPIHGDLDVLCPFCVREGSMTSWNSGQADPDPVGGGGVNKWVLACMLHAPSHTPTRHTEDRIMASGHVGKVVDIHTHMYPPEYIKMLEARSAIPLVRTFSSAPDARLILLEAEVPLLQEAEKAGNRNTSILPGRPLTRHYSSLDQKMHFMDTHHINISVLSLANPWLDFLGATESGPVAASINEAFSSMCAQHPGRLFFFATLPLTAPLETVIASIAHVGALRYCRGVILGTSGLGRGLDDAALLPVLEALAAAGLTIFLHPHYGLPNAVWGPRAAAAEYGHVLPLALGFPMETTVAVARMYLAGVFDAVPALRMLLAHSGGTLPFLAGRIESCLRHDGHLLREAEGSGRVGGPARRSIWDVLHDQVYLDAVIYSEVGLKAALHAAGSADRLMFGTDHPFFPPLTSDEQGEWESVSLNTAAVNKALGEGTEAAKAVMGENAIRVLRLHED